MPGWSTLLQVLATVAYGAALALYVESFLSAREGRGVLPTRLLVAGLLLHAGALSGTVASGSPEALALQSFSLFAFLTGLLYWLFEWRFREGYVALVALPVVIAFQLHSLIGSDGVGADVPSPRPLFYLHIFLIFLGYAAFVIAFATALMYLLQHRQLKGKRWGRVFRLFPSLEKLDRINYTASAVGFPALTLGIAVGFYWAIRLGGEGLLKDPKVIAAMSAWVVLAAYLLSRLKWPWQGRRGAFLTITGFLLLMVSYLFVAHFLKMPGA